MLPNLFKVRQQIHFIQTEAELFLSRGTHQNESEQCEASHAQQFITLAADCAHDAVFEIEFFHSCCGTIAGLQQGNNDPCECAPGHQTGCEQTSLAEFGIFRFFTLALCQPVGESLECATYPDWQGGSQRQVEAYGKGEKSSPIRWPH